MAPPVASTALNTGLFPQYIVEDGRWAVSGYDANGYLVYWPNINNNPAYTALASSASATHVVSGGKNAYSAATASWNQIQIEYNSIIWLFPPQVAVNLPDFLTAAATMGGYTFT